jgi:hypothetical protein
MSAINNIFQWNTPPPPEEVNNDHNLYEKDPGVSFRGTDYIIGNPGFVNEAAHDYRLTEYSTARNNGSSENAPNFDFLGVSRPQGIGFDIGAYEYISSNVVPSFGTPNPANNSNGNPLSLTWSIPISDANGDTFNWSIQFSLTQYNNANGDSNGTKSCLISGLSYNTTYKVWVNATDPTGSGLYTRKWYTFTTIANQPPGPPTITGPTKGKVGIVTDYNFTAIDSDNNEVYYFIDWGDTTNSGWIGPYASGVKIIKSHTWSKKATYNFYTLKAKAKDSYGNESGWATLSVIMPYSYNIPFMQFWERLFERFPHAFPILRQLLGY